MSKSADLIGNQYGRLLVIGNSPKKSNRKAYLCQCSCGEKVAVLAQSLKSGLTKSCGCLHKELSTNNLIGKQFGSWNVIGISNKRAQNGYCYWKCQCRCGVIKEVSGESLLLNKSKSCNSGQCSSNIKQICCNGHDTSAWGRTKSQACKACIKDKHLRTHYGITLEEFLKIYNFQNGKCFICGKELGSYLPKQPGFGKGCRIEVDHDHKKGKRVSVRGLLCGGRWAGCNRKLGRIDNIKWLNNVIKYLEELPAQKVLNNGL